MDRNEACNCCLWRWLNWLIGFPPTLEELRKVMDKRAGPTLLVWPKSPVQCWSYFRCYCCPLAQEGGEGVIWMLWWPFLLIIKPSRFVRAVICCVWHIPSSRRINSFHGTDQCRLHSAVYSADFLPGPLYIKHVTLSQVVTQLPGTLWFTESCWKSPALPSSSRRHSFH